MKGKRGRGGNWRRAWDPASNLFKDGKDRQDPVEREMAKRWAGEGLNGRLSCRGSRKPGSRTRGRDWS